MGHYCRWTLPAVKKNWMKYGKTGPAVLSCIVLNKISKQQSKTVPGIPPQFVINGNVSPMDLPGLPMTADSASGPICIAKESKRPV